MSTLPHLPEILIRSIQNHGLTTRQIAMQLECFRRGFPDLKIIRPATVGDGIMRIPEEDEKYLLERFKQARTEGRVMKFVPASGAATRMFKTLQSILNSDVSLSEEWFNEHSDDEEAVFTRTFLENIEAFAFYDDLVAVLEKDGKKLSDLKNRGDYRPIISYVLEDKGLGLAALPKALIPFHRYEDHNRTALEEHLAEAINYTRSENGNVRIHFTISPEHKPAFKQRLESIRQRYESGSIRIQVETSFQKPETDTIAVDPENRPFLDDHGNPVFRPGGHGALLVNLEELKGDIVFIKNIDNVVPDRLKVQTCRYNELLGGYLITLQDKIFFYLKELDRGNTQQVLLDEIIRFIESELYVGIPPDLSRKKENEIVHWLFYRLNRPIRVCGMVKDEGEPGGGPFFIRHENGTTSLQIVESAQINFNSAEQKELFESSTHFSPTDLVCSLRDYQGRPFSLEPYRDPDTGFISIKSYQGRELKALELPGLWNGSMAFWNTVFVEIPSETFNPVKTVNDLLRKEHRNG
ncbi:MAG: DUF4301 family protein [Balneolales bacterium]